MQSVHVRLGWHCEVVAVKGSLQTNDHQHEGHHHNNCMSNFQLQLVVLTPSGDDSVD